MHLVRCLPLLALDSRSAKGGISRREEKLVDKFCRCNISIPLVSEGRMTEYGKMFIDEHRRIYTILIDVAWSNEMKWNLAKFQAALHGPY